MNPSLVLSFVDGVVVHRPTGTSPHLQFASGRVSLDRCSAGLLDALEQLSSAGATEEALLDQVAAVEGRQGAARLAYYLGRFGALGLLRHGLTHEGSPLATLVPFSPQPRPVELRPLPDVPWRLSRFAYVHRVGSELVVESPLAHSRLLLHSDPALAVLRVLTHARTLDEIVAAVPALPRAVLSVLLSLLLECGALATDGEPRAGADEGGTPEGWEFHDLLFHSRSRMGRHRNAYGATHRFLGVTDPLPAVKPRGSGALIELCRPDLDMVANSDPPFTEVLEKRRSIRDHGNSPISVDQLGEFLYRCARIRSLEPSGSVPYEHSSRPYPGGGACYELEIYPVVDACAGLQSGIYHYDPLGHTLESMTGRTEQVERLLEHANWAAAHQGVPQVLLVVAARFGRIAWAYEGMAYAAVLKHCGVLYQTMYLVATAMGLAACALGGGDSDLFAEAVGLDYTAEGSVGEFMLGRA